MGNRIDRDKRNLQALASPRYLALADPIVQWPRTPPFHGGNTGSNPVRVASFIERPTKQIGENKNGSKNRFNKISDVLDVLHERPSARIEKNSPSPIKFFARIEGFSFGRFAFCRNYDAARMRIIQVRPFGAVAGCIVALFIKRRRQLHLKDENGSK